MPTDGEFVRWLQGQKLDFEEQSLTHTREYGQYSVWDKLPKIKSRPFNRIEAKGDKIYKIPVDEQGRKLAVREQNWYRKLDGIHYNNIPEIYEYDPLCLERIDGKNIYEYSDISCMHKREILKQIVDCLKTVHCIESAPLDEESYRIAYLDKTYERLKKVRFLVPFANEETVIVNGCVCRNIFYHQDEVERIIMQYIPKEFKLIHGDCTFSNIMLKWNSIAVLLDPRGYFGKTEIFGDAAYDWVKLYYSVVSNYDQFNLGRFDLYINEGSEYAVYDDRGNEVEVAPHSVRLEISSNNWECLEDYFFELLEGEVTRRQMKIFLAITWFSLTTYAWNDYDSICGAFYNGCYYLEKALQMKSENEVIKPEMPFQSAYHRYFEHNAKSMDAALRSISLEAMENLVVDCENALRSGHKIISTGLGKNVPICEKFVGTMSSLGFAASFMHTNNAVHGDIGMVRPGDVVILLSKSGATAESVYLTELLQRRVSVTLWLISFTKYSELASMLERKLIIALDDEGDKWNLVPNNSSTVTLIILQELAIELSRRFCLDLDKDFKPNHPGGAIGAKLRHER